MGKVCDTCGQTRWEGRQVDGWITALEADRARLREALEYAEEGCARALRLAENDRGSDRMAYQVVREMSTTLAAALHWNQREGRGMSNWELVEVFDRREQVVSRYADEEPARRACILAEMSGRPTGPDDCWSESMFFVRRAAALGQNEGRES